MGFVPNKTSAAHLKREQNGRPGRINYAVFTLLNNAMVYGSQLANEVKGEDDSDVIDSETERRISVSVWQKREKQSGNVPERAPAE